MVTLELGNSLLLLKLQTYTLRLGLLPLESNNQLVIRQHQIDSPSTVRPGLQLLLKSDQPCLTSRDPVYFWESRTLGVSPTLPTRPCPQAFQGTPLPVSPSVCEASPSSSFSSLSLTTPTPFHIFPPSYRFIRYNKQQHGKKIGRARHLLTPQVLHTNTHTYTHTCTYVQCS